MKILVLSDGTFPFVTGGMQKHTYFLVKNLIQEGHEVLLVHAAKKEESLARFLNIQTPSFQEIRIEFPSGLKFPGHYILRSYQYSSLCFEAVKEHLSQFDLIYIQGFSGWKLLKQLRKLSVKGKVILNLHGLEMYQINYGIKGSFQAFILRLVAGPMLLKAPFVQSLGGKLTKILLSIGIPQNRILEIPIALEETWIRTDMLQSANERERSLVFIGRNERRKGFPELEKAVKYLQEKYTFKLHVIGAFEGDQVPGIVYHGLIKEEEKIKAILDTTQALVCPSYSEGMPTVILEAMARGNAVIATNVGAVSKVVNKENGWLIEAGNEKELISAIENFLTESEESIQSKRNKALKDIKEKFMWKDIIRQILK